jgi:hypothetical protein
MNTLVYVTHLPEHTSQARELQWEMEFWQRELVRAGAMKNKAWQMRDEAIDAGEPCATIEDMAKCAEMFDAIYDDTWEEWNKAQASYLRLFN